MSYDLQVWSVCPPDLAISLPEPDKWSNEASSCLYERRDWHVAVGQPVKVLPEDLPEEVAASLPGIAYLTELNLSPVDASDVARKFLVRTGTAIAKATHGVIFDPQRDQITLPSGIKRFASVGATESASVISLSW